MSIDSQLGSVPHDHVFLAPGHDENARRTLWVMGLTSAMMIVEIVAGTIFNSMALLADGVHMATHAGAFAIAGAAYVYARRQMHNRRFTFGTGKVGDLAGFASAVVLGLVAVSIAVESVIRLFQPATVAFGEATVIAIVGLLVNLVSAVLLGGGHHHGEAHDPEHHHGHEGHVAHEHHHHDNNFRSAYLHVIADALTSVLAIAALLAGRYLGRAWLDPTVGIIGAAVIASWSFALMRDTAAILLDTSDADLEREIREEVEGAGDARIVDLHVWRVGPGAYAAIVAVAGIDREAVRQRLLPVHEIAHLTVEAH